ncbi:flagellar hook-length control protein FliK [Idiomarina fontislapidosi]|uniref:Flagellar hook-length control protein-like C-terminal domain-containing protein n=1 Tax=Idiomarina fontislapidosi TaxID=263723 RepID=A0A432XRG4_9GAMM|nr:flagellar hook-length control protein FliK [Idiomarina fontislapidosi]PYE31020.1 flagellar hook-length control protein FliK [Idiomarina fontislapidosi]RUO51282.1 hypothetical protein CWE25_11155 [Idiomarina fontislapidosi]
MPNIMQIAANAQGSLINSESASGFSDLEMQDANGREFAELLQPTQQDESQRQLFARQAVSVEQGERQFSLPKESNELPQSPLLDKLKAASGSSAETASWIDTIERMRDLLVSDESGHGESVGKVELDAEDKAMLDKVVKWLDQLDEGLAKSKINQAELSAEQQQAVDKLINQAGALRQLVADAEQRGNIDLAKLDKESEDLLIELSRFQSEVVKPQQDSQWTEVEQRLAAQDHEAESSTEFSLPKLEPQQREWLKEQLEQFRNSHPGASLEEGMAHVNALLNDVKSFDAKQHQTLVAWVEKYQSHLQQADNKMRLVAVDAPTFQPAKAVSERSDSEVQPPPTTANPRAQKTSDVDTSGFQQIKQEDTKPSSEQSTIAKMVKDELKVSAAGNSGASNTSDINAALTQSASVLDNSSSPQQTQQQSNHVTAVTQVQQTLTKVDGMSVVQAQTAVDKPLDLQHQDAAQKMQERIQMMVSKNIQRADIRLDPPELGSMHVRIHTQGDQTTVQFQVQSAQAREAIEQTMPRLREMLEQQGLNLAESSVSEQQGERGNRANAGTVAGGQGEVDDSVTQLEASVDDFLAQGRLDFYV